MKYISGSPAQLLSLVLFFCFITGCKDQLTLRTDDFYRFDNLTQLSLKKTKQTDYFIGIDKAEIPLIVTAYGKEGSVLDAPQKAISFYVNETKIDGESFLPDREGTFQIVGKLAGQVSDTMRIRVWDPASLSLKLSVTNSSNTFYASGQDSLMFKVDVMKGDQVLDLVLPFKIFVNGSEQSSLTFSTTTPNVYRFQAKVLGLVSNELTISALSVPTYATIRIPVIFHEINRTTLTAEYIQKLTGDMTKAFRNKLNFKNAAKDPNAADLFIEFYPAETGLDGSRLGTPGLHRAVVQKTSFTYQDTFLDAFNTFWDPEHYLNIWVYPNITGDYQGSSWGFFPLVTIPMEGFGTGSKGDTPWFPYGIFLNGNHVGNNNDGGRTEDILAHEAGHMLGLDHVFDGNGSNANACSAYDPDHCADTPYYDRNAYLFDQWYERTSCQGIKYISTNFMDYAYSYNNSFTKDQLKRVRHTIDYGLWLPTPYNGARSGRKNGVLSLVPKPQDLRIIKPVICAMK